jgi:excisionase family DNA binding protein
LSALQEWYRYVDSLVRPSRKFEELEEWWVPDDDLSHGELANRGERVTETQHREPRLERSAPSAGAPPVTPPAVERAHLAPSRSPQPPPPRLQPPARPSAPPVDPRAVVARLSGRVTDAPPSVEWHAVPGECKIPDLDEFIPHLSEGPSFGTATREFIEGVARFQVPPRRVEEKVTPVAAPRLPERLPGSPRPSQRDEGRVVDEIDPGDWLARSRAPVVTEQPEVSPPPSFEPKVTPAAAVEAATESTTPVTFAEPPPTLPPVGMPAPEPMDELQPLLPGISSISERPDLPTITSIREGLPRTMERLLQIPIPEEVAQNSYKSPFRETREELIRRLFDPPLTLEDTARLLGVCPTTVRRYTNKGLLRHYRTQGNQRRFRLSDLLAFLERWGDAGPEAGALGGSASTRRPTTGRPSRKSTGTTGGDRDAEKTEGFPAAADAARADADRV